MSERHTARLSEAEARLLLTQSHKCQLATINPDGTPHLVTMFYILVGDAQGRERLAFWTYRASQKARNLERDPRLTCLVEAGEGYFELRGVQIVGVVEPIDDPDEVARIGAQVVLSSTGRPAEETNGYVAHAAPKRRAYVVQPVRTISWDHRRLAGAPAGLEAVGSAVDPHTGAS